MIKEVSELLSSNHARNYRKHDSEASKVSAEYATYTYRGAWVCNSKSYYARYDNEEKYTCDRSNSSGDDHFVDNKTI